MGRFYFVLTAICIFSSLVNGQTGGHPRGLPDNQDWLLTDILNKLQTLERKLLYQETEIHRLQQRVDQQGNVIDKLQTQVKSQVIKTSSVSVATPPRSAEYPRTCAEILYPDSDGIYLIDPDGPLGDEPIGVICDVDTGTTTISHDSEVTIDVNSCLDPGCYTRNVTYLGLESTRQLRALALLSHECHQSIKVDCFAVPFEYGGVKYAWWNDINGNKQYFWAGSNSSVHTCQCGIEDNCLIPSTLCNCDTLAATNLVDDGVISSKDLLPVTQLNFGRTSASQSTASHTLGKLECSGREVASGIPKSCSDLWFHGQTISGIYSVQDGSAILSVYCDFNKVPGDEGFEQRLGSIDVKSSPVYFYVQRNTTYTTINTTVPYEVEKLNLGGAMNLESGVFTAPVAGVYFFAFHGLRIYNSTSQCEITLRVNGELKSTAYAPYVNGYYSPLSVSTTLELQVGDKVDIWLFSGALWGKYHTGFNGMLLQEEFSS